MSDAVPLLKAADVGRLLGLSARTVYTLAKTGALGCYKLGGAVRFSLQDVEAYKTSCRSPATTPAAGCISLTASSPEPGSALTAYFQQAGRGRRRKSSTASNPPASMPLRLVSQSQHP